MITGTLFWRTIRLISSDPALMMERLNTLNYRQLRPQRPQHQRINRSSSIMAGLNLTNMITISHHFAGRTEFMECACSLYLPQTCTLYWWDTRNDLSVSAPGQVCSGYRIIIIINTWIMTCQGSRVCFSLGAMASLYDPRTILKKKTPEFSRSRVWCWLVSTRGQSSTIY